MKNILAHVPLNNADVVWSEAEIQVCLVQHLRRAGFDVAADMNAAKRSRRSGANLKAQGMTAGEPDLRIYLPGGKLLLVELKTARGQVSKAQRERHLKLEHLGFPVIVVRARCPQEAIDQVMYVVNDLVKEAA